MRTMCYKSTLAPLLPPPLPPIQPLLTFKSAGGRGRPGVRAGVAHFERRLEAMAVKGMIVCMSRRICMTLYDQIIRLRPEWHADLDPQAERPRQSPADGQKNPAPLRLPPPTFKKPPPKLSWSRRTSRRRLGQRLISCPRRNQFS
jgi:hypothetical protein